MNRVGRVDGAIEVLVASGFIETADGYLAFPLEGDVDFLHARKLELIAGLGELRKSAAQFKSMSGKAGKQSPLKHFPSLPRSQQRRPVVKGDLAHAQVKKLEAKVEELTRALQSRTKENKGSVENAKNDRDVVVYERMDKTDKSKTDMLLSMVQTGRKTRRVHKGRGGRPTIDTLSA